MPNTLEGPLNMVEMSFTSLDLIFHANLLKENGLFSNFDKMYVCRYFYANDVISDRFKGGHNMCWQITAKSFKWASLKHQADHQIQEHKTVNSGTNVPPYCGHVLKGEFSCDLLVPDQWCHIICLRGVIFASCLVFPYCLIIHVTSGRSGSES